MKQLTLPSSFVGNCYHAITEALKAFKELRQKSLLSREVEQARIKKIEEVIKSDWIPKMKIVAGNGSTTKKILVVVFTEYGNWARLAEWNPGSTAGVKNKLGIDLKDYSDAEKIRMAYVIISDAKSILRKHGLHARSSKVDEQLGKSHMQYKVRHCYLEVSGWASPASEYWRFFSFKKWILSLFDKD